MSSLYPVGGESWGRAPPLPSAAIASSRPSALDPKLASVPGGKTQQQVVMEQEQQRLQQQQHREDVAGVLRRNQACLACRRRKLKCDAIRPHCSTCIRSHKHMMRTAPTTNPVLSCDYDDGHGANEVTGHIATPSPADDDGESSRKKRKSNAGDGKRKKDNEAEMLKKRIEELEAKLASTSGGSAYPRSGQAGPPSASHYSRPSTSAHSFSRAEEMSARSPSSFLDILSTAATVHAPDLTSQSNSGGLRAGVTGSAMMNGATGTFVNSAPAESPTYHSGFTPSFTYADAQQSPTDMRPPPIPHPSADSSVSGQDPSDNAASTPSFLHTGSSGSTDPVPLTPSGIFNFSPGPPEPVDYESMPFADKAGMIHPSSRLSGPWRGIETIDTFVATAQARATAQFTAISEDVSMPTDPLTDPTLVQLNGGAEQDLPNPVYSLPFEEDVQQQMMDLFWPGWPSGLPEPHIVQELIDVFFDMVPSLPRMLLRSRFMTRMTLPPTHSNFPHPALLHSVCAIASNWCAPAVYEKSAAARTLNGSKGQNLSFSTWQSGLAKEAVHDGLNTGDRMLDVVRSMMILSRLFIDDTRMLECWAYHGLVARMLLPLGLNVRSAELSLKSVMLPPPVDATDREERRGAMWFAFYHDTVSSAASGWGSSISLDELTCPLPCSAKDFESGSKDIPSNPQDIESPDLFTHHPVVDPFVLCLKACIIMNRCTRFARKWKNRNIKDDDDLHGLQKPEFRELANNIACLQMSFPYELRNPCKTDNKRCLDIDLIVAHLLPHSAIIILHEPFADVTDSGDASSRRILAAAQATVGLVQQLATAVSQGSNNFSNVMHSAASVCLVTAGRTCLLFYRHALNVGDNVLAAALRSDIEMIRMALEQFGLRFKIGHHHAQLIAYFLDRATNPTYEKVVAHYPDHPRPGAPILHPGADMGLCIMNALNVKRGYWRIRRDRNWPSASAGISPLGSTPESGGGTVAGGGPFGEARIDSDLPQQSLSGMRSASGSASHTTTLADLAGPGNAGVDDDEVNIGAWLPDVGVNRSSGGNNPTSASLGPLGGEEWEKILFADVAAQTAQSAQSDRLSSGEHDPFAAANDRMKVHPDGQRNIFGTLDKDAPAGMGARLTLPCDASVGGEGRASGTGGTEAPKKGGKGGVTFPLMAETAAWFMAPEPGGFRGPKFT